MQSSSKYSLPWRPRRRAGTSSPKWENRPLVIGNDRRAIILGLLLALSLPALAEGSCPGNPEAIGTSRTLVVDPKVLPQVGTMQYSRSVPLADHEVVLTFDDGPLPPHTNRVLDILEKHCVKANYFLVGQMARAHPDLVRRIHHSGHVVGTHTLHHPLSFSRLEERAVASEVEGGIKAVETALGDVGAVAPFFRIPGLYRSQIADRYLLNRSLAVFSADQAGSDWRPGITSKQIVEIAMRRIEAKKHRGILLLHDINPITVAALPLLLKELKAHGYRIVQVVPPSLSR